MGKLTIKSEHYDGGKGHFRSFYPPADWDRLLESKEYSLYYSILLKQYGQERADYIWGQRDWDKERQEDLFQLVKDYKPKNKLNIIGDLSWGLNTIKNYK